MNLHRILYQVKEGELAPEQAAERIAKLLAEERGSGIPAVPAGGRVADLGFAKLDLDRESRTGFPEVIYGQGKSAERIAAIIEELRKHASPVIATRIDAEKAERVRQIVGDVDYIPEARALVWRSAPPPAADGYVALVCAGTSDVPVAEEAALIAECMGCRVERIYDVGVAGIHRLFAQLDRIRGAAAVIVVAGMEGALASVVGGLVSRPVIAVPTSVGYGASFQGVTALLAMLNACAPGIAVVNIDNGFGAGYMAGLILRTGTRNNEFAKGKEAKPE